MTQACTVGGHTKVMLAHLQSVQHLPCQACSLGVARRVDGHGKRCGQQLGMLGDQGLRSTHVAWPQLWQSKARGPSHDLINSVPSSYRRFEAVNSVIYSCPQVSCMPGNQAILCCHLFPSTVGDDHSEPSGAHLETHGVHRAPLRAFPRRYGIARIWLSRQYGLQLPATTHAPCQLKRSCVHLRACTYSQAAHMHLRLHKRAPSDGCQQGVVYVLRCPLALQAGRSLHRPLPVPGPLILVLVHVLALPFRAPGRGRRFAFICVPA